MKYKGISSLFAVLSIVLLVNSAQAKSLDEVCKSSRDDCDAIFYTSKIIEPTYKIDRSKAQESLKKLGWDLDSVVMRWRAIV